MSTPRELLNRIKWSVSPSLGDVVVYYVDRGAPSDVGCVQGEAIEKLERGLFVLKGGTHIPYHRIFRIEHRGTPIYYREDKDPRAKPPRS